MIDETDETISHIQVFFDDEFDSRFTPVEIMAIIDFFNGLITNPPTGEPHV